MSKKSTFARDVKPGYVIRLVYEVEVDEIGDLDAKFASESEDLYYISGKVTKGPLHKQKAVVEFAISGEDRLTVVRQKSFWKKVKERLVLFREGARKPTPKARKLLDTKVCWSGK